jgi:hypothetical protein
MEFAWSQHRIKNKMDPLLKANFYAVLYYLETRYCYLFMTINVFRLSKMTA